MVNVVPDLHLIEYGVAPRHLSSRSFTVDINDIKSPPSELLTAYSPGRNQTKMLGGLSQGRVQVGFSGDEFEGEAQVDGAKRPRTEGEAREEAGEG